MIGLAAKEVAGRRAGLIAAVIAAIYPNFWINAGLGLSETLILLLIAAVVLVSFKLWRRPDTRTAVTLGLLCGLAALTRAEQSLLLVVLLVPLTLLLRQVGLRRRLWFATTGVVAAIVLMAPWVGFNLSRFSHATFLSNDSGTTLAMANCRAAYSGPYLGYGDFFCLDAIKPVPGDESAQDAHYRRRALRYVKTHLSRLPIVLIARPAREFGFFAPVAQLKLEAKINGRPLILAEIGLGMYYVMLVTGLLGAVILKRRRLPLVPFVGILIELVLTAMLTYGQTRYRAPFEVVLVVLSAVTIDAILTDARHRRGSHTQYARPEAQTVA
jgi:4-amino-4-deoxy-L-arabinose transferase-like glycosyltransferase